MNVLILVNGAPKYKYFFYRLAQKFSQNGHGIFYAIDSHSSDFLEPLHEIDNKENTFYFSDYFEKNFERQFQSLYTCTYGEFYYSDFDRFLTHHYNLNKSKYYWKQAKLCLDNFYKTIIEENKIDLILYENISNTFAYSAWRISQLLNKQYVGIMAARIPGRFELQTSIIEDEIRKIEKLAKLDMTQEDLEWFNQYRQNISTIQPDYMKTNGLSNIGLSKLFKLKRFKTLYRIIKISRTVKSFYEIQRGSVLKKLTYETLQVIKRYFTSKLTKKYYTSNDDILLHSRLERFFVYPVHYHPESSTSVLAPDYTNEYNNIINISNKLPLDTYLYVKDHESAKGVQPILFYKKIAALPNVRLVNSSYNIKELIIRSQALITINSTAAYESLLLSRHVFMFGRAFFENFPYITKLQSFQDLKEKLNSVDLNEVVEPAVIAPWYIAYKNYTHNKPLLISNFDVADDSYFEDLRDIILKNVKE